MVNKSPNKQQSVTEIVEQTTTTTKILLPSFDYKYQRNAQREKTTQ